MLKSKVEIEEMVEDVIATSEHKHLISDLAVAIESLIDEAYNKGFSDGAGDLPF